MWSVLGAVYSEADTCNSAYVCAYAGKEIGEPLLGKYRVGILVKPNNGLIKGIKMQPLTFV